MSIGKIVMDVKPFKTGLRAAVLALTMLVVSPATFAQRPHSTEADSPTWNQHAMDQVLDRMTYMIKNRAYVPGVDFSKWDATLATLKPQAEKAKTEDEFAAIVDRGLQTFNISHIVLLPPEAVDQRDNHSMIGIGVRIQIVPDGILVTSVVAGGPAEKAGLEQGDTIVESAGHKADRKYIAGPEGTTVVLKVKKADGTMKTYNVLREPFDTAIPEQLIWVDKDTAVIKISSFDLSYKPDNVARIMKEADKAKNLLVDLRGNGGGAVTNMMQFLSFVLPSDTVIGTFIDKKAVDSFVDLKGGSKNDLPGIASYSNNKLRVSSSGLPVFTGHIAVLVDPGSGSASEITAEALKEIKNAPIVGARPSAGAVLVSVMQDLGHRFSLQYPISDYISLNGVRLEGHGIVPTVQAPDVAFLKKGEVDPAYVAAETALNKIAQTGR